jgi:superfamily II DNA helicase RecQ
LNTAAFNYNSAVLSETLCGKMDIAWRRHVGLASAFYAVSGEPYPARPIRLWDFLPDGQSKGIYFGRIAEDFYGEGGRLREMQQVSLDAVFEGSKHVIVCSPVGSGKSICYLGPAWAISEWGDGFVLLFTPLRAASLAAFASTLDTRLKGVIWGKSTADEIVARIESFKASRENHLGFSLLIASYESLATDPQLSYAIFQAACLGLIVRVVQDEILVLALGGSYRNLFLAVNDLSGLTGRVPFVIMSATALPSALPAIANLCHLDLNDCVVVSDKTMLFNTNIQIDIQVMNSCDEVDKAILHGLSFLKSDEGYTALPFVPRRAMILCPTTADVIDLVERIRTIYGGDEKLIAGVDGETPTAVLERVIAHTRIIVGTSVVGTAVNVREVDLIIIAYTTYSVQVGF